MDEESGGVTVEFAPSDLGRRAQQVAGTLAGQRLGAYSASFSLLQTIKALLSSLVSYQSNLLLRPAESSSFWPEVDSQLSSTVALTRRLIPLANHVANTQHAILWRNISLLCKILSWNSDLEGAADSYRLRVLINSCRAVGALLRCVLRSHGKMWIDSADNDSLGHVAEKLILAESCAAVPQALQRQSIGGMQASEAAKLVLASERIGDVDRSIGDLHGYVARTAAVLTGAVQATPALIC